MARTIGKRNIALVKRITQEEIKEATDFTGSYSYSDIEQNVIDRLPKALFDTWEMADSEISRIISNTINKNF